MLRQRHAPAASETSKSAQVANHFQRAGLEREAAHYYKEAGDTSRNLYANAEALGHYQSALALGYEETAVLHEAIGDLLTLRGDYENALTSYETAAAQIDGSDQSERLARLEMKLGGVYHRRGDWSIAASHYGQSLELSADSCQRARLPTEWSLTAHHGGESDRALALAKQAFEQAEEVGDKEALALAHNVLGILANSRGDYEEASQQLKESLALAEDLDNNSITIAALNNLSLSLRSSEQQEEALLLVDEALSLCIEIGDRHREAALHNNMADLLHELGRSDEAMAHLKEAAAIYSDIGGEAGRWRPEIWMLTEW